MITGVPGRHRITVAVDKGYDTRDLVAGLRAMHVTPQLAQHTTGPAVRSMDAPHVAQAIRSPNNSGNWSSKTSPGRKMFGGLRTLRALSQEPHTSHNNVAASRLIS